MKLNPKVVWISIAILHGVAVASAAHAADARDAISPEKAGRFFASICYDLYLKDVGAAQVAAQRAGFVYDETSGLFVHKRKDQQMRINSKRCALRFLTRSELPELVRRFGSAATKAARTDPPAGTNVHIGTENAGSGLTRAAAKFDR